jgi:hypothetical protein
MAQFSDGGQQPCSAGKQYMTRIKIKITYAFIILFVGASNKRGTTGDIFNDSHVVVMSC